MSTAHLQVGPAAPSLHRSVNAWLASSPSHSSSSTASSGWIAAPQSVSELKREQSK